MLSLASCHHLIGGVTDADPQTIHVAHGSYHDSRRYLTALGDQFEELDRASSQPVPAFSKSEFFRRTLPAGALVRLLANLVRGHRVGESREPRWFVAGRCLSARRNTRASGTNWHANAATCRGSRWTRSMFGKEAE